MRGDIGVEKSPAFLRLGFFNAWNTYATSKKALMAKLTDLFIKQLLADNVAVP